MPPPHDANPIWPETETPWIQELQKQMYVVATTLHTVWYLYCVSQHFPA